MALFRYWERLAYAQSPINPVGPDPFLVAKITATRRPDDTFTRAITWPRVVCHVHKVALSPPEPWWQRCWWMFIAFVDPSTTPSIPSPESGDERIVFAGQLRPAYQFSGTIPTDYYVTWEAPDEGFQTKGMRKGSASGPLLNYYTALQVVDPLFGITVNHPSMEVSLDSYDEVLWSSSSST
jgi:hypothetical protein